VIRDQTRELRRSLRGLRQEGFRQVHVLASPVEVETATIERTPLWNNRKTEHGPFDIIGDVHGCWDGARRVDFLVNARGGLAYFYDVNALSNFVANAAEVIGFDPFVELVDFLLERARTPELVGT
jgi:hypothetical protein